MVAPLNLDSKAAHELSHARLDGLGRPIVVPPLKNVDLSYPVQAANSVLDLLFQHRHSWAGQTWNGEFDIDYTGFRNLDPVQHSHAFDAGRNMRVVHCEERLPDF